MSRYDVRKLRGPTARLADRRGARGSPSHVVVVIDLNAIPAVAAYEIPDRIRDAVCWRSPTDLFPYGTQPSRPCDLDHTNRYQHHATTPPGQTRITNLAIPKAALAE